MPASRFTGLDYYPFRPLYAADHAGTRVRIHYLDVGPPAGQRTRA